MNEKIHSLLELCLKLKYVGVDAFFQYSPHANWITIFIYLNGWVADLNPDIYTDIRLSSEIEVDSAIKQLQSILEDGDN